MTWMIPENYKNAYVAACIAASTTDLFDIFKQDKALRRIFEHTRSNVAEAYLEEIRENNPWLLASISHFADCDHVGSGIPQQVGPYTIVPSTMKYIGILSRLITQYGPLNDMNILEIGGGYGGQYKIISDMYTPASYTIVDIREALELAERYCNEANLTFIPMEPSLKGLQKSYDLVISSYALTEVGGLTRAAYDRTILPKAKHGWIQCNTPCNTPFEYTRGSRSNDIAGERESNHVWSW